LLLQTYTFYQMRKNALFLLVFLSIVNVSLAQSPGEVSQSFKGFDFVYQNYEQELNLFIKDDVPVAERKTNVEMLMLTNKNFNFMSRYRVYHSGYNELMELNAYTKVPDGNKYKTLKVSDKVTTSSTSNSVFYDDTKETMFDFPGLTQYAVTHVDYVHFLKDAHLISEFYIPNFLPVIQGKYIVRVPNNIKIKYIVKNDPAGMYKLTEEKKKRETVYTWEIKNIKPDNDYPDAPDLRYFQPHIIVFITSFENKNGTQPFLNTIDDLHKWNASFIKNLNIQPDPHLKKIVDSLTKDQLTEKGKARIIYQWVQQHIRYVAFEDGLEGFRPRQAGEVCAKRYGDCKDMSSIITQMLRMAGIKAYYTWIGTRDIPYKYSETPLPIVDNHMISAAQIEGNWMFFDGTDPNARYDMPPAFIQGKEALVSISENEFKILTIPIALPENSLTQDSTFIKIADDGIRGYETVNYNGYFGKEIYNTLLYTNDAETKKFINKKMSKGSNKFILGKFSVSKTRPEDNAVNITADFEIPGYSKKIGNEYFINLNLEKIFEHNIIDIKERKAPMEIDYNFSIKQYHILEIPKGYSVTYLPKNFNFENALVKINMYYKVENEKVIAAQEIQNKKLLIYPSEFEDWNKPMKAIQPFYNESVVLEKK
jgi:hypothetical protein